MQCTFISIVVFCIFFPPKSKICSQVIALAMGLFIKNLIVLLIRKVFMHFNLPSLTWEQFFFTLHPIICLLFLIWQWNAQLLRRELLWKSTEQRDKKELKWMKKTAFLNIHFSSFHPCLPPSILFFKIFLVSGFDTQTHTNIKYPNTKHFCRVQQQKSWARRRRK